jgi:hypothetical protein
MRTIFLTKDFRSRSFNGIRPADPVPIDEAKIRSAGRKQFQGVYPKCGASGHQSGKATGSAQGVEWENFKPFSRYSLLAQMGFFSVGANEIEGNLNIRYGPRATNWT